jgi:hypothetical protein
MSKNFELMQQGSKVSEPSSIPKASTVFSKVHEKICGKEARFGLGQVAGEETLRLVPRISASAARVNEGA